MAYQHIHKAISEVTIPSDEGYHWCQDEEAMHRLLLRLDFEDSSA
jgi:hypothetical protein